MREPTGWTHAGHATVDSLDRRGDLRGFARYQFAGYQMVLM
jgi:hypothetical protein